MKQEFSKDVQSLIQNAEAKSDTSKLITAEDFADFPPAIQKYVEACGYIGTPYKAYLQ